MSEPIYTSRTTVDHFNVVPYYDEGLQFQVGSYSDLDRYEIAQVTLNAWGVGELIGALLEWQAAQLREATSTQSSA